MRSILVFRILFFTALCYSLYLFLAEGIDSGIHWPHFDKVGHFMAFAGLSLLFDLAFSKSKPVALSLALLYGVAVEVMQLTVSTRQGSIGDVIADMAGSLCYYYVFQTWCRAQLTKLSVPLKP